MSYCVWRVEKVDTRRAYETVEEAIQEAKSLLLEEGRSSVVIVETVMTVSRKVDVEITSHRKEN